MATVKKSIKKAQNGTPKGKLPAKRVYEVADSLTNTYKAKSDLAQQQKYISEGQLKNQKRNLDSAEYKREYKNYQDNKATKSDKKISSVLSRYNTTPTAERFKAMSDVNKKEASADSANAVRYKKLADKATGKKMKSGGKVMIKRADGSVSQRGLWDNIRANKGSGKKPTAQMLKQEKKIKSQTKKK
jgi:hypothetical protein